MEAVRIGPTLEHRVWVSSADHMPAPVIVRAVVIRAKVRVSEELVMDNVTILSSTSLRCYEIGPTLKDAIYGRVVRATLLEKIPPPSTSTSISTSTDEQPEYRRTNQHCAIKIYQRKRLRELQGRTFENPLVEIPAMQYIGNSHPNLMGQIETCSDDENLYVVMRFCPGGELFDYIGDYGPLDNARAKDMFRQLIGAVSHLQRIGLAHRDMSLENVLYDGQNIYVVIDFGMVVRLRRHQHDCIWNGVTYNEANLSNVSTPRSFFQYYCWVQLSPICGKKNYIAPEVFIQQSPANPMLADMWALGIMLFIALTGVPPVDVANDTDDRFGILAEGRLNEMLEYWGYNLDPAVVDLLTKMLNVDPTARPTIEEILAHAWMATP